MSGDDPLAVHQQLAATLDEVLDRIAAIQSDARAGPAVARPAWPMIVLRTPKGWTGPKEVDGKRAEGSWRSHQVPLTETRTNPAHLRQLEEWMRSYHPETCSTHRAAAPRAGRPGPHRSTAHGCQSPGQRRLAPPRSPPAGLP